MAATRSKKGRIGGAIHAHGCTSCRARYTDGCDHPDIDSTCITCTSGRPGWQLLIDNMLPKDCCYLESRPVRREEHDTYHLSRASGWWICTTCARTQPFRPSKESHDAH